MGFNSAFKGLNLKKMYSNIRKHLVYGTTQNIITKYGKILFFSFFGTDMYVLKLQFF